MGTVTGIAFLRTVLGGGAAQAHGTEGSDRASDLVLQAIALIVNEPDNHEMIKDKIQDALKARDTSGVDLELVRAARASLAADQLHRTRSLLERSIGARAHRGGGEPAPIREVGPTPAGAAPGRALPSDPLPGRSGLDTGDIVVLGAAIVVAAIGVALAIRYRPRNRG